MNDNPRQLDDYVEAYEIARTSGDLPDLSDFTPTRGHPERFETVIELVRVDLEYGWRLGTSRSIDQYRELFPDVLQEGEGLKKIAFEEFRLRRLAGESISKEAYCQRYAITTDDWPDLPVGESTLSVSTLSYDDACLHELSQADAALGERFEEAAREMPEVGERFERFDLVGELGKGAFGRVFLARQDDLAQRFVALKITAHLSAEPQRLAQLQHTNIVPIHSVHRRGPLQAICMPFLGPSTLADVLRTFELSRTIPDSGQAIASTIALRSVSTITGESAPHNERGVFRRVRVSAEATRTGEAPHRFENMDYLTAAVWIVSRVADGLAYAHEHGIVHRDLKPANILLTDDGEPLLLDFNLATVRGSVGTTMALIGGTLPYIGPEHMAALQHGGDVGPESDVYSLGVILFQMLTGRLPYPSPPGLFHEIVVQMRRDRQQTAPAPRTINPLISPGLDAIVQRCLVPDPKQRYLSARELQEDLQRHLDHRPLQHATDRSTGERLQKWTRRHPRFASATTVALLALVVIIALAALAWTRHSRLVAGQARDTLRQIESDLETARAELNSPFVDNQELDRAVVHVTKTLDRLRVSDSSWEHLDAVDHLDDEGRRRLNYCVDELVYHLAGGIAQQAVRSSDDDRSASLIKEALRWNALLSPSGERRISPKAILLQRARFMIAENREAEAAQLRAQAEALAHESADRRTLAFEYAQQGRYQEAASLLEKLVGESPQDHTVWFCLGNCYLSSRRSGDAEWCYSMAIALRPKFTLGYEYRGLARLQAGKFRDACDDFDEALIQHPGFHASLVNRAIALKGLGESEAALQELSAAIEQDSTQTRIYFMRSRLRSQLGDSAGAARDYEEGMRRTPQDELSWVARGIARLANEPAAALADFRRALKLNPRSQSALQNIAHVLSERLGDPEGALEALNQLIALEPPSASALAGRGVLLARRNQRDAGVRDAEAALRASDDPLIIYQVGCIYALNANGHPKDRSRAIQCIVQALQGDSSLTRIASEDPDLAPLRGDDTFRNVLTAARLLHQAAGPRAAPND